MPRVAKKTARPKTKAKRSQLMEGLPEDALLPPSDPPVVSVPQSSADLVPPTRATEPREGADEGAGAGAANGGKTINISQLQAMSMAELNLMAKEMGIENFGTMKK